MSDETMRLALKGLLTWAESQICPHDQTHRGGAIWEICDDCGAKFADDEGGKPAFEWPAPIIKAQEALSTTSTRGEVEPVAGEVVAIVPPHCTGISLAFEPGVLHVSKDGSGYIAIDEKHFELEDDRCEGPDGPEGSVHWITRLNASEVVALRDFLNGVPAPQDDALRIAVEALERIKAYRVCKESANIWTGATACRAIADETLAALKGCE